MNKQELNLAEIIADGVHILGNDRISISPSMVRKLIDREGVAEERGYKRGSFHTGVVAIVAIALSSYLVFGFLNTPYPQPYLPPAPGIVLDTPSDSSYLNYRQGSPEGDRRYDSAIRAERGEGKQ